MNFTKEDFEKIAAYLRRTGIRDTELREAEFTLDNTSIPVVQDGENRQMSAQTFVEQVTVEASEYASQFKTVNGEPIVGEGNIDAQEVYYCAVTDSTIRPVSRTTSGWTIVPNETITPAKNKWYVDVIYGKVYYYNGNGLTEFTTNSGTVTGIKIGSDGNVILPINGVVELPEQEVDLSDYVQKDPTKDLSTNDYTNEDKVLVSQIPSKANASEVVKSISVNGGQAQTPTNGNVNIEVAADVSVTTNKDGTFTIHAGGNDYIVNLNHTHENMAKLEKFIASNPPATMDNGTIYAQVDNITTPTQIESLWLFGCQFAGGAPDTGEAKILYPSNGATINLGTNEGSGVSKTITVKGKNLTGDLTVAVGTGLTISYGQTLDGSSVTIPMAQALLGAQVTISYSGTGALDDGSLVISQGNDVLSSVVVVVVPAPVPLTAIKLTGTQWLQTDYYPNANTEFELDVKFSGFSSSKDGQIIFDCVNNTVANTEQRFRMYYFGATGSNQGINFANERSISNPVTNSYQVVANTAVNGVRGLIKYVKGQVTGTDSTTGVQSGGTFSCGQASVETSLKSKTMENPLKIGHGRTSTNGNDMISDFTEFVIYGFKITEGGTTVRNYVPATLNGVPGLYDTTGNGGFISSQTSTPVVAIE